jgi:hypothetical protein
LHHREGSGVAISLRLARIAGTFAAPLLCASLANSETVSRHEFLRDFNGYPCFITLNTDSDASVTLQLSDYDDVWSINLFVSGKPDIYRNFFDRRSLRDDDAFRRSFGSVTLGKQSFKFSEVTLFEVQKQDVDEKTAGLFGINEQHNVVQTLEAMKDDGIIISGLINLNGTIDPLSEFRTCSYSAMGLSEGEPVETDFRAEYRMIFERAFEVWVSSMAQAEHCLVGRYDDGAVDGVIDAAADAFYPGLLSFSKRSSYREELEKLLPLAKLTGMADAKKSCLMADRLVEISRIPVDRAIEEAANLH